MSEQGTDQSTTYEYCVEQQLPDGTWEPYDDIVHDTQDRAESRLEDVRDYEHREREKVREALARVPQEFLNDAGRNAYRTPSGLSLRVSRREVGPWQAVNRWEA